MAVLPRSRLSEVGSRQKQVYVNELGGLAQHAGPSAHRTSVPVHQRQFDAKW